MNRSSAVFILRLSKAQRHLFVEIGLRDELFGAPFPKEQLPLLITLEDCDTILERVPRRGRVAMALRVKVAKIKAKAWLEDEGSSNA